MLTLKKSKKYLSVFIFLFLVFITGCEIKNQKKQNDLNDKIGDLAPFLSFGHKGEVVLANPFKMVSNREFIFISDPGLSKVFQYGYDGNFIKSIGKTGRGPGEFEHQSVIFASDKRIFIQDQSQRRLIAFDLKNDDSKIFNQNNGVFIEAEEYQGLLYGFAPKALMGKASDEKEGLIHVYDLEGKLVDSFGDYLAYTENMPAITSWPLIEIEDGLVHVLFFYFPLYRIYSIEGKLIAEFDLTEILDVNKKDQNYKTSTYNRSEIRTYGGATGVFRAFDVHKNRVFIPAFWRELKIDELIYEHDSLRLVDSYRYFKELPEDYYVKDFFYSKERNMFYILEKDKSFRVTAYKIIEDSEK